MSLKSPRNNSDFGSEETNRNESEFSTDRDTESLENNNFPKKKQISESLESTKIQILKKIEDLECINKELRTEYVPIAVVNNFNRSIKDVDVS